jgi:hypothetical protein
VEPSISTVMRCARVVCPVLFGHLGTRLGEPAQIVGGGSGEETPPEDRVTAAQRDEVGGEAQQLAIDR